MNSNHKSESDGRVSAWLGGIVSLPRKTQTLFSGCVGRLKQLCMESSYGSQLCTQCVILGLRLHCLLLQLRLVLGGLFYELLLQLKLAPLRFEKLSLKSQIVCQRARNHLIAVRWFLVFHLADLMGVEVKLPPNYTSSRKDFHDIGY